MKLYQIIKRVKDDIPGFRDWDEEIEAILETREEAEEYLSTCKSTSIPHAGYGAGPGYIVTTYRIEVIEK